MKTLLSLTLLVAIFSNTIFSQNKCKVTYIANEGFLIETVGKKILVDALFDKIDGDWCDSPTDSVVELMKNANAPFNDVDIIAVTHNHRDHFNKDVVANHLLNNQKGILICPDQVKEALSENPDYKKFYKRIISVTPNFYSDSNIVINDIKIRIMRLEHSHYMMKDTVTGKMMNKHHNIENLGYLFNISGTKLFHCGDTNPLNEKEYSTFSLIDEKIDIGFIERLFIAKGKKSVEILNKYIAPKNMVLMHIGPRNRQAFINHLKDEKTVKIFENKMDASIYRIK